MFQPQKAHERHAMKLKAALQEDINDLTAGKADAQAVKDLQETVAALQTAITENDITKNRRIEFPGQRTDRTGEWNRRRLG